MSAAPADPVDRSLWAAALATGLKSPLEMFGGRSKRIARSKHIAVRVVRARTELTLRDIAWRLRYSDHTCVIHAIQSCDADDKKLLNDTVNALLLFDGGRPTFRHPTESDVRAAARAHFRTAQARCLSSMMLMREFLDMSYPEVAVAHGLKHPTAMERMLVWNGLLGESQLFSDAMDRARARLRTLSW